jgi:DNA-binding NarL/FixJ family response regulator
MGLREVNMLLVEDNPLVVEAYEIGIRHIEEEEVEIKFNVTTANSCDSALYCLENKTPISGWDLAFLDLRIPPSSSGKYLSGPDIGVYIRQKFPQTKVIIATGGASSHTIRSIFKEVDPDGFLFKSDISMISFRIAVLDVLNDKFYFGKGVQEMMRKEMGNDFFLDELDRKILYELSRGTKTANLPEILPLSLSSIARRKRKLKEFMGVEGEDDKELLEKARQGGLL